MQELNANYNDETFWKTTPAYTRCIHCGQEHTIVQGPSPWCNHCGKSQDFVVKEK